MSGLSGSDAYGGGDPDPCRISRDPRFLPSYDRYGPAMDDREGRGAATGSIPRGRDAGTGEIPNETLSGLGRGFADEWGVVRTRLPRKADRAARSGNAVLFTGLESARTNAFTVKRDHFSVSRQ